MQFIAASLGVECSFCHVPGKMDADDKPAKKTAREMMLMTTEINKNHFGGRQQMTCYSCHRGSAHPVSVPAVLEADMPSKPAAAPPASGAPPNRRSDPQKYVAALGGPDAMRKVNSRQMTGKILAGGVETPIDVLTKAPNKRVSITHGKSDSFTAFDGSAGWMGSTGRPARTMTDAESASSALDAEFYLALRLKELYPQLRRGRPRTSLAPIATPSRAPAPAIHPSACTSIRTVDCSSAWCATRRHRSVECLPRSTTPIIGKRTA